MLKQQYNDFLVDILYKWLSNNIKEGHRYKYYSENHEYLKRLSNSFHKYNLENLIHKDNKLCYIKINEVKLIILSELEMNNGFISNLRDEKIKNSSLLIFDTSKIDTLDSTTINLELEDYPLNPILIKDYLETLINEETKYPTLFKYLLEYQTKFLIAEEQSAFGYEALYNSVIDNKINFQAFELFKDEDLYNLENDKKSIEKRIKDNEERYRKIKDTIINFPNELDEKLQSYSPEFIKDKITINDWPDLTYNDLKNEEENNKGQKISFDKIVENMFGVKTFIRSTSSSAAGQRAQNIIIFTKDSNFSLSFKFNGYGIKTSEFSTDAKNLTTELKYDGGKRELTFSVKDYDFTPNFFNINLKRIKTSENHKFRVLLVNENDFNLDLIKNHFIIKPKEKHILLQLDEDEFNLDFNPNKNTSIKLEKDKQEIDIETFGKIDIEEYYKNNDEVNFTIKNGTNTLTFFVEGSKDEDEFPIPFLFDKNRAKANRLFNDNKNTEFNKLKNKAIYDGREKTIGGERLNYIKYEQEFIDKNKFILNTQIDSDISHLENIDQNIYSSFKDLISYFRDNRTTPSLCAWNDELFELSEIFINSYLEYMKNIEENIFLSNDVITLFEFGFVYKENKKMMSPFSPLILSYIINLVKEVKEDESFKNLSDVTLNRLNAKGLFPYLYINSENYAFTNVVKENSLWLEFIPNEENEFSYIKKLSLEKIDEFTSSFQDLFEFKKDAPLIINSINNSKNEELFEGIVTFYKKTIKESKTPIKTIVNIYDENYHFTSFDLFADLDKYDDIKNKFSFIKKDDDSLIDIIRTNLSYSKHNIDEEQNYSHLSFFKNNERVQIQERTFEQTKSGLLSNGLISGESSQKDEKFYYSGFGLKNVQDLTKSHIQLAKIYNSMQKAVYNPGANYKSNENISLMISENFRTLLKKSYKSSLWTVVIDPKVTLDFFDNEENLILIHYSDQYSSSANYDAVTVTAQKELYSNVLFEELGNIDKENIVKQFNAFNGEWLIKMITENDKNKKEKESIISAYKYMTSLVDTDEITWVPMSVAEMIRVSGNVGLSMSDSDFSRYNESKNDEDSKLNKGAISDDILLVGFKDDHVILYPVEVKSSSADIKKAIEQSKSLRNFFYEHLFEGNSLKTRLLKGLFIRQVFMQVEKYELYDIFDESYFNPLYEKREQLLDGEFKLIDLDNYSKCSVIAFLEKEYNTTMKIEEDIVLKIQMPYPFQKQMIHLSYDELKDKVYNGTFGGNEKFILSKTSETKNEPNESTTTIQTIEQEENLEESIEEIPNETTIDTKPTESLKPIEIKFGMDSIEHEEIFWYPTDTRQNQNTNTGIIGTMGTGKTQFTKSLVTQLVNQSSNNVGASKIDMIIFDYKGDYIGEDFVNATNATVYELEKLPINPLELFGNKPKLPTHTGRTLTTTLAKAFNLGNVQKSILKNAIQNAYQEKGIESSDKDTWNLTAPTLEDVWDLYTQSDDVKQDSLYAALDDLIDFEIFESDTSKTKSLYDVIDGVTVMNLSGYDSNIQNLVVAIILDLFYVQMHNRGSSSVDGDFRQITKMILVDEADNFMSQDFDSLKKILKEGREFGVGTILSTQELTHFKTSEDNYANYIFTWIVHKVANIKTQDIQSIFNINSKVEAEGLMSQVRELQKHYSFYVDGNKEIKKMRDLAFWELNKLLRREKNGI